MSNATKTGARHSSADMTHINHVAAHAKAIAAHAAALGAAEDVPDELPMKAVQIDPAAHSGAMVALMLTPDQQQAIRDASGMPDAEADHVTLAYLGDASAILSAKNAILRGLSNVACCTPPLAGEIGGVARFSASESSDNQDVIVALYDSADLPDLYADVIEALEACGVAPASDHGFTPHITLAYIPTESASPIETVPRVSLPIASLSLIWAGERIDLPFDGMSDMDDAETTLRDALGMSDQGSGVAIDGTQSMAGKGDTVYAPIASIKSIGDYTLLIKGIVRGGKDLVDETFTKDTDLGFDRSPVGMPVYYDHAKRGIKSQVGKVTAWEDMGDSIDFTVELDRAKRYANQIMQLQGAKALGGSTGALGHLVIAEDGMLKRWIVGELSLTPTPAEPRTRPDLRDTKSADAPETDTQTVIDHPVAVRSVLPTLVSGYMSFIEHDITRRYTHNG